jgi:dihydrofolate reductase
MGTPQSSSSRSTLAIVGYGEFIATVDGLVMGRHTFELARSFPDWQYGEKPVVVLSRTLKAAPTGVPKSVQISQEPPAEIAQRLAAKGLERLYVDGGSTIQQFIAAGLIDEITTTRIPILLGKGKPLFGQVAADPHLDHLWTRSYAFGFVQSKYRLVK